METFTVIPIEFIFGKTVITFFFVVKVDLIVLLEMVPEYLK